VKTSSSDPRAHGSQVQWKKSLVRSH
jgi:hypothetical protein